MLPMANLAQRFLESVITERPGLSDRSFNALRFSDFEPVPACEHSLDAARPTEELSDLPLLAQCQGHQSCWCLSHRVRGPHRSLGGQRHRPCQLLIDRRVGGGNRRRKRS